MPGRKQFIQQLGLIAGAFSANSLFNQLHAAEIAAANKKVNHLFRQMWLRMKITGVLFSRHIL